MTRSGSATRASRPLAAGAVAVIAAAAIAFSAPLHAQITASRIAGTVTDETGSPIPNAVVRASNPSLSPPEFTDETDERGQFAILGLGRGLWTITASATGFEPVEISLPVQSRTNIQGLRIALRRSRSRGARSALAAVDVAALTADLDRAEALAADGRIDEALALYEQALRTVPALTAINRQIGDLCLRKRERARALDAYERLLDAHPDDAGARAAMADISVDLGLDAERSGEREAAIRHLERALDVAPEGARAGEAREALARLKRQAPDARMAAQP